jgi:hypothetical protein
MYLRIIESTIHHELFFLPDLNTLGSHIRNNSVGSHLVVSKTDVIGIEISNTQLGFLDPTCYQEVSKGSNFIARAPWFSLVCLPPSSTIEIQDSFLVSSDEMLALSGQEATESISI